MKLIYKLERKFGKYAIPDLMKYIMGLTVLGAAMGIIAPQIYYKYLMLDFNAIAHGQVWRLVTFVLYPRFNTHTLMIDIIFLAVMVYLYYSIGRTELDNPNLEFRYCSKCDGNYEYCSDHLFTHEHVHRE